MIEDFQVIGMVITCVNYAMLGLGLHNMTSCPGGNSNTNGYGIIVTHWADTLSALCIPPEKQKFKQLANDNSS